MTEDNRHIPDFTKCHFISLLKNGAKDPIISGAGNVRTGTSCTQELGPYILEKVG